MVADLCEAAYAPFVSGDSHYVAQLRDVARRAANAQLLVAAEGQRVLGTVTFVPEGGPLGEIARPDETEFRMLAVDPQAQGHGVGEALVRACADEARRAGRARLVISSATDMTAAHRLYERVGFTRAPERDWKPVPAVQLRAYELAL